jgi:hypothetical protein
LCSANEDEEGDPEAEYEVRVAAVPLFGMCRSTLIRMGSGRLRSAMKVEEGDPEAECEVDLVALLLICPCCVVW